ncbi:unnamed protein product, partial [Mesorhabditis belari]|uniref:Uncharacterized protein n=1 Tax=Mesorhabditis belari TaxID=2138241 RepID=A0AAF3FPW1_9BILA
MTFNTAKKSNSSLLSDDVSSQAQLIHSKIVSNNWLPFLWTKEDAQQALYIFHNKIRPIIYLTPDQSPKNDQDDELIN